MTDRIIDQSAKHFTEPRHENASSNELLLREIRAAADMIAVKIRDLAKSMSELSESTPDIAGVVRRGNRAISVSSSVLFATGTMSQFSVDAKMQVEKLVEIVGKMTASPSTTEKSIAEILSTGKLRTPNSAGTLTFNASVIDRFRILLTEAQATSRSFAAISADANTIVPSARRIKPAI